MELSRSFDLKRKIVLTPGVSQFRAKDKSLLVKHNNKIYRISAASDHDSQLEIFRILQRPRKLKEILNLLSEFKNQDVIDLLQALYRLKLITYEGTVNKNANKRIVLSNIPDDHVKKGTRALSDLQVLLIGTGFLAHRIAELLRALNIKCNVIKSFHFADMLTKRWSNDIYRKGKDASAAASSISSSFIPFFNKSDLVIVAEDYPNISLFESINKICFRKKKAWIRVSFDDNIGYLGPLVIPNETSCFNCCELRLVTNSRNYEYELWNNKERIPKTKLTMPEIFVHSLSAMCLNEVLKYLADLKTETIDNLYVFDTQQLKFSKHKILTHPNCIYCNPPQTKKKIQSKSFSIRSIFSRHDIARVSNFRNSKSSENELITALRQLIDNRTGLILESEKLYENNHLGIYFHHFFTATCSRPLRLGLKGEIVKITRPDDNLIVPSPSGCGRSPYEAEMHALMESVERYSSMVVDESRLVWSTYNDIKAKAINPVDLGLYSDEQYNRNDLGCSKFSVHSVIPWIKGYDLYSGKPVMIPADFVHYPPIREKPLVFDTSNGAAAHTDIVQAILNGLFEVIERDAFLTMWLNRSPMPILDIKKIPSTFVQSIKLINEYGMKVKLLNLTSDSRVPTVLAACYNSNQDKYPALVTGTGSHVEPERAVQKALFEMEFGLIVTLESPSKKINNPNQISSPHENALFYENPAMRNHWQFMLRSKKKSRLVGLINSTFSDHYSTLMRIVGILHAINHRVIWVDITPSDIRRIGLRSVKVFVTGFQPFYVGTKIRLNSNRLYTSAIRFKSKRTSMDKLQLNYAPHPLP
jgi:ribosomal protein S12 methylthiotransferase accessory factor